MKLGKITKISAYSSPKARISIILQKTTAKQKLKLFTRKLEIFSNILSMIVHRNEDNKCFFVKSKQTYEKEIYLNVKNVDIRKSISKLMLLSDKLKLSSFHFFHYYSNCVYLIVPALLLTCCSLFGITEYQPIFVSSSVPLFRVSAINQSTQSRVLQSINLNNLIHIISNTQTFT